MTKLAIALVLMTPMLSFAANVIDVGSTTQADLLSLAGDLFSDLSLFWILAIGLPVAFYVINRSIGVVTSHTRSRKA